MRSIPAENLNRSLNRVSTQLLRDCLALAAKNDSNLKKPALIVKKIIPQNPSSLAMISFMISSAPPPMEMRRESLKFLVIRDSFI